jgi:hypothetical protein
MFDERTDGARIARARLGFLGEGGIDPTNPLLSPSTSSPQVSVTASWGSSPADKPGTATSTVDGHAAALGDCASAAACDRGVIFGVDGFALEIEGNHGIGASVLNLYEGTYIHQGANADPATWGSPIVLPHLRSQN